MWPELQFENYRLSLDELYRRMWEVADPRPDGTRLFRPRPGGKQAIKWLVDDLSGAKADPKRTTRANNALRKLVHQALLDEGWVERINQVSFQLLRPPEEHVDQSASMTIEPDETDGTPLTDVRADGAGLVGGDALSGGEWQWSAWTPLDRAAQEATTSPGVYIARSRGDLVYVGMAGERKGHGVRGRLRIYSRGRGAVSGLGEAALDRALADPKWIAQRLVLLHESGPERTKSWAVAAIDRAALEVAWAPAPDASTARAWELELLTGLEDAALWNRARPRPPG